MSDALDKVSFIAADGFSTRPTELWVGYAWNPFSGEPILVPLGQPKDMTWEDYIKDRDVVREFWLALRERCPRVREPSAAGPDEEMTLWQVCWDNASHHVDVDLLIDARPEDHGANEWFYMKRPSPDGCSDGGEEPSDWIGLVHALDRAGMLQKEGTCGGSQ